MHKNGVFATMNSSSDNVLEIDQRKEDESRPSSNLEMRKQEYIKKIARETSQQTLAMHMIALNNVSQVEEKQDESATINLQDYLIYNDILHYGSSRENNV